MRDFASVQLDPWLRARGVETLFALALAPAFAWMNPFISGEQPFPALLGYWGGLLASWFMLMATVESVLSALDVVRRMAPASRRVAVVAVAAVPMIAVAGAATHVLKGWKITPYEIVEMYFQIVLLGSGVAVIAHATFFARPEPEVSVKAAARVVAARNWIVEDLTGASADGRGISALGGNRLMERVPAHLRGRLLCLEMEDHYVRIHTDRGSALVLMRLSDAMAEAELAEPGRQVHRSWWVSDGAIERFERLGRTGELYLSGGIRAPVSQRYLKLVEGACICRDRAPETRETARF